jgi:hypothetical protein
MAKKKKKGTKNKNKLYKKIFKRVKYCCKGKYKTTTLKTK